MSDVLPQSFYERDALVVAPELLGKLLCRGSVVLRISEVEAYCHPNDSASHCRMGRTPRNAPMWGPAGHAYVYLCYGMHSMLNLVTNREGEGAAVLIRACELVSGHEVVRERRSGITGPNALTGPGKVGAALALTMQSSGTSVCDGRDLYLLDAPAPAGILAGPRVGIGYASQEHQSAPWRFALAASDWVSQRKTLSPLSPVRSIAQRERARIEPLAARSVPGAPNRLKRHASAVLRGTARRRTSST